MAAYENFDIEREDSVVHVTIDSTSRLNALNPEMGAELLDWASELPFEDDVRCLTISAAGDAFGAGADLTQLAGDATDTPTMRKLASQLHDAVNHLHSAPVPIVTGVNGVAAGAGFGLAIMGDIVLISDGARLEFAYPRLGLTGDGGSTFFLPRLVGLRRAKEIVLRDEPIGPEEAVDLGLASEVVPAEDLDGELRSTAAEIAAGPTWAMGQTKRLLTESFDRDLAGQMAAETETIAQATTTEDYERAYEAFFEKSEPEFVGR